MIPVFAPKPQLQKLVEEHSVSEALFNLSQALRRHYAVDAPLKIGILSGEQRIDAFMRVVRDVEQLRVEHSLSDMEAAMLLLAVACKDSKCNKAMKGFHFKWHQTSGAIDIPQWLSHVGYKA